MKYAEFIVGLKTNVEKKFMGSGAEVVINSVIKNNDSIKDGLMLKKEEGKPSPLFYLDDMYRYYQCGADIETISCMIMDLYKKQLSLEGQLITDTAELRDLEHVKEHITYKLLNREWNRHYLENAVYIEYLDLAVVFYCTYITEPERNVYSVKVTEELLNDWNVNREYLLELAGENTRKMMGVSVKEINEVLKEGYDMDDMLKEAVDDSEREPMYILSNISAGYGAVNILIPGVLSDIAKEMGDDLYIIPSSVHEVILIPVNTRLRREEIDDMVKDINGCLADSRDVLADHVYIYSRHEDRITM